MKKAFERGLKVSFAPKSTNTEEAISEFAQNLGKGEKVLYAKGQKSLNRLNDELSSDQVVDFVFYTTKAADFPKAQSEHLLFTSPSNVNAYFDKFPLEKGQLTYAIGNTTARALEERGYTPAGIAKEPSEKGFWEILT
jgi:uroporphyrinogen-III synthase